MMIGSWKKLLMTPVLLGLGMEELSVGAALVPQVKAAVRKLNAAECREWMNHILTMDDAEAIHAECRKMAEEHYPELI